MREGKISADRLTAFSDAVFAVIVTIMVLELKAPDHPVFAALWHLWPTALSYAVSYLFIRINFVHLFMVSLLPFATAWVPGIDRPPQPVRHVARPVPAQPLGVAVADRLASHTERELQGSSSGLHTPRTRLLVSIRSVFGDMPILQPAVHRLASDQHRCRGILFTAGTPSFRGDPQIYLPGDQGDNHNDGADAEGSECNLEVLPHGEIAPYSRR